VFDLHSSHLRPFSGGIVISKTIDLKLVGLALLPALGICVVVAMLGRLLDLADSVVNAVSLVLFFPVFLGAYHARRQRLDPKG
jgi:hypothetical protein